MAEVIIDLKIMPDDPKLDMKAIEEKVKILVTNFGGEVGKVEFKPLAFGLNEMHVIFVMDEATGSTESLEKDVAELSGVSSVEVVDVRRAIG